MPLEIEIKLRINSLDTIRHSLTAAHATRRGRVREHNIFFDRPDRSLLAAHSGLRVRLTTSPEHPEPQALLTFKGPPQSSGLHARLAYDLHLTPHDQIIPLLEALGFTRTLSFEKFRESWTLDHCLIELDELPHLGTFTEIEGPSEPAVLSVQQKLHLQDHPPIKPSYIAMVDEYLQSHGTARDLTF
jgi:predicted adenylyl cyclase CyaB